MLLKHKLHVILEKNLEVINEKNIDSFDPKTESENQMKLEEVSGYHTDTISQCALPHIKGFEMLFLTAKARAAGSPAEAQRFNEYCDAL